MKSDKVLELCPICGKTYELGYTGMVDGCDACLGVIRDKSGYAWESNVVEKRIVYPSGKETIVKRPKGI